MSDEAPRLIALDWGTSSLRAYLLAEGGGVLDQRSRPWGIMRLPAGGFAGAFHDVVGDWRAAWPSLPAIAAGMIGSAQGWAEAPYCPCPAGVQEIAAAMLRLDIGTELPLYIVPGVEQHAPMPNVMRGEETQIIGALCRTPGLTHHALLVLPGTHCKWATVAEGRITHFETFITGELFAVLRDHSILGRPAQQTHATADVSVAFDRGVALAREAGARGMAPLLFLTRSLVLHGDLAAAESLNFLSGLLIGDELRAALADHPEPAPVLIGAPALCARYQRAFANFGRADVVGMDELAPLGLWHIARASGLVPASPSIPASPEVTA